MKTVRRSAHARQAQALALEAGKLSLSHLSIFGK
jgi:hypothetical protein